jgi:Na+/glutamate symporter
MLYLEYGIISFLRNVVVFLPDYTVPRSVEGGRHVLFAVRTKSRN